MENLKTTLSAIKWIKAKKKVLSEASRVIRNTGNYPTINEWLRELYWVQNSILKTFHQWRYEGKLIRKWESSYVLWSKPIKTKTQNEEWKEDEFEFYNLCFLFSENQVE